MRRNIRNKFPTLYLYFNIRSLKNRENLGKSNTFYLVVTFGPTCVCSPNEEDVDPRVHVQMNKLKTIVT
jgi:hypothetical protein